MTDHFRGALLVALYILAANAARPAAGASYRVIFNMQQYSQPNTLVEGSPGVFYVHVVPPEVIISVTTQGTITTLATFANPPYTIESNPGAMAANGLLYSSVELQQTVYSAQMFSVGSAAGSEQIYASQSLSPQLASNLPDGKLFGIVYSFLNGSNNLGTADLRGNVTSFYQFPSTDLPAKPIYGADGNYYGTAAANNTTYFYRVTPSGSFTKVATFPLGTTDFLGGGLVLQGTDGNFYGIQSTGLGCSGSNQHGGVYKLTPSGQYTLLHDFGVCGNGVVNSLIEASDGKLYGATQGNSVIFSLTTSGTYKKVFQLNGADGICGCGLLQGSDGIIYGAASGGGTTGSGVIFALDVGLPVPRPRAQHFHPASGPAGAPVLIWGYNLFGASVQFNGVTATTVRNAGSNYVWATVPAGASTGPITVTTPGGTVTTQASFTVQ